MNLTALLPERCFRPVSPRQPVSGEATSHPLFSIITPTLNRAAFLPVALASVAAQIVPVEHIVVDGASEDATPALMAEWPAVQYIRGPDRNSHDAMNKGLDRARGDFVGFLNSDDCYEPGLLETVAACFARHPEINAVVCAASFCRRTSDGEWTEFATIRHSLQPALLWLQLTFGIPAFNSWFFRREVVSRLGGLNDSYLIAADRDFLLRFAAAGNRIAHVSDKRYLYLVHADSATLSDDPVKSLAQLREHERIVATLPLTSWRRRIALAWGAFEAFQAAVLAGTGPRSRGAVVAARLRAGQLALLLREIEARLYRAVYALSLRL